MAIDRLAELTPSRRGLSPELETGQITPKIINIDGSAHILKPKFTVIDVSTKRQRMVTEPPLLVRGFKQVAEGLQLDLLQLAETNFQLRIKEMSNLDNIIANEGQVRAKASEVQAVNYFVDQLQELADVGIRMPDISLLLGVVPPVELTLPIKPSPAKLKPTTHTDGLLKPEPISSQIISIENYNAGINPEIPEIGILLQAKTPGLNDPEVMHLTERAQSGDKSAFEGIYARYVGPIYRRLLRIVKDPEQALDLAQEVFIKAQEKIGLTKTGTTIGPWLYRMANNLTIDKIRVTSKRPTDYFIDGFDVEDKRNISGVGSFDNTELSLDLADVLKKLTGDQRAVLECRYLQGMDTLQTANALGKTIDAVKKLQSRGLKASRKLLVAQISV